MNRITLFSSAVAFALTWSNPSWAQPRLPHSPSTQELQLLPQECLFVLAGTQEQKKAAHERAFPTWVGPNHYCWGLNFMNRARFNSADKIERRFNLQSAIGEFGYVLKHSPSNAPNLDQVKMQVQMAEMMLKMQK